MQKYAVVCYEVVVGYGPLCWCGEQEYTFNSAEEARSFVDQRILSLGEKAIIYDENKKPSGQHLITVEIRNIRVLKEEGAEAWGELKELHPEVTRIEKP